MKNRNDHMKIKIRKKAIPTLFAGLLTLCFTVLLTLSPLAAESSGAVYSWYAKKCGKNQPQPDKEQELIFAHHGYYLDRSVNAESGDKVIYLTFDAGYENGNVAKILDALKAENAHGAFFILDRIVLKHPDLLARMSEEGHLVCNHTKNHKDMTKLTPEEMEKNLTDLEKIYTQKTGKNLSKYFRFPEGRYSESALTTAEKLGYSTIFWSFAYPDWDNEKQPNPEKAVQKILENTHNGEVILLHPTSATNAAILPILLKEWKAQGYRFGTLDELVARNTASEK